eukprot:TRINITY_DN2421_c2_g1_i1.p1 TRINITY_DN2421_c2_g1~~TRINITY_DN2421_c2_g1_i1.p1  ORF type:complete len:294 (+),score=144.04 TRINITY_DN2421_c2_g1_i1:72-953(+)
MVFVKVVKAKSYFMRYQVKYRRRREGKTDYAQRRTLITQDKNKYNSPKYRLVVRFTNKDCICQIVSAHIKGDRVLTAAYSHELPRYGVPVGLTNYAAGYCTGLLVARRHLQKIGLDKKYIGKEQADGEDFTVEPTTGPRPFKALLDIGLARTSTGARIFAAMKGALDGGLNIPHSVKRYVGYATDSKSLGSDILRKYIFGGHVADYMRTLQTDEPEAYNKQFSQYIKAGIKADDVEKMYKKAHSEIRANPKVAPKKAKSEQPPKRSYKPKKKLKLSQRKARSLQKIKFSAKKA